MGRRKLKKTAKQKAKQRREWADNSNRKRKERYAADAEYRKKIKEQSRATCRRTAGNSRPEDARYAACQKGIDTVGEVAQKRYIVSHSEACKTHTAKTITSVELAPLIGLSHVVMLHKWHRSDKFPRPSVLARVGRTHANVYTVAQAKKLIRIMRDHYKVKSYYYNSDTETLTKLFAVM